MRQALEDARFNRWPVAYYPLDHVDGELIDVKDWEGLLFVIEKTLITCKRIYGHMTTPDTDLIDWKNLQPPELVELLDNIRNLVALELLYEVGTCLGEGELRPTFQHPAGIAHNIQICATQPATPAIKTTAQNGGSACVPSLPEFRQPPRAEAVVTPGDVMRVPLPRPARPGCHR